MSLDRRELSIRGLHVVLGAVLLLGAWIEVAHAGTTAGAEHLPPAWARLTIAWSEIVAAILFLVVPTVRIGAFLLLAVLVAAIAIHLAHGQSPAALLVYAAAVLVVLAHRGGPRV